jgi:hypothetical protein
MTNVVVCQACFSSLYRCRAIGRDYAGEIVKAEDWEPMSPDIDQPLNGQPMLCPRCGEPLALPTGDQNLVLLLEDGSFWPHPPPNMRK